MSKSILGLHHVTCITAKPQEHVDFYTRILGLRLVKLTVNFDDPTTYHTYFGDEAGSPGTLMTFFPWPNARPGRVGTGQVSATAFSIPEGSSTFWMQRLNVLGVNVDQFTTERFGETVLALRDPDRMTLELIESSNDPRPDGGARFGVPAEHAIKGFHGVTVFERELADTQTLVTETMGFTKLDSQGNRTRFATSEIAGGYLDTVLAQDMNRGVSGAGTVHHIAWRTPDDVEQSEWRQTIESLGITISPVMDRTYFHSIYFREPGGVLFEIATDSPGMAVDEELEKLGHDLLLPPQYREYRQQIEAALPKLVLPESGKVTGTR